MYCKQVIIGICYPTLFSDTISLKHERNCIIMNEEEKSMLWPERIQEFHSSGQTCKGFIPDNQKQVLHK